MSWGINDMQPPLNEYQEKGPEAIISSPKAPGLPRLPPLAVRCTTIIQMRLKFLAVEAYSNESMIIYLIP